MVGNKIAMVAGCSIPVLLRQRQDQKVESGIAVDIVGDAFVSGVMWGEKYAHVAKIADWTVLVIHRIC